MLKIGRKKVLKINRSLAITLPPVLKDTAGIRAGDVLEVYACDSGDIVLKKRGGGET